MPKEAREPLFCCGAQHQSANYHKRTVHQQHTKIYWKGHPQAGFILRRNPLTSLFHCPKCDKSWAMATPVRNHIFQKCAGYAQYRNSTVLAKVDREVKAGTTTTDASQAKTSDVPSPPPAQTNTSEASDLMDSDDELTFVSASGNNVVKRTEPQDQKIKIPGTSASSSIPPVLRPAIWSPVDPPHLSCPPLSLSGSSGSSRTLPSPRSLSACSSISSARTLAVTAPISRTIAVRFKSDPDDASVYAAASRCALADPGLVASSSLSLQGSPERPTAVRTFLDGLRRALGHAAPLFYKMGLITEEDLALICTMPDAWDELGVVLQAGGLTTIEWLMVKEAFKTKARGLSE